jgi:tryptophan halogenase
MVLCWQSALLVDVLRLTMFAPPPTALKIYNNKVAATWDDIRHFLTLHYWANTALDTPFWRQARNDSDIEGLRPILEFYDENGPTGMCRYAIGQSEGSAFGVEGYLVMLVGNSVPYRARHKPTAAEWETWRRHQAETRQEATRAYTSDEMVQLIRQGAWRLQ